MKSSLDSSNGIFRLGKFLPEAMLAWLVLVAGIPLWAAEDTNTLEIQSISVNGKSLSFQGKESVSLGSSPENIVFSFGPGTNAGKPPLRLRYMLEGYDNTWQEYSTAMALNVRFYNSSGDQIDRKIYSVVGETTGWTGSLKSSALTHRRETMVVPPQTARVSVAISSAGPPETVGIYVVANLVASKSSDKLGNVILLQSPFESVQDERATNDSPVGWVREGGVPSMAKIVEFGQDPQTKALAIVDDDPASHAEWHSIVDSAPVVKPGDNLVVEWNEMYSMGAGGSIHEATYGRLPAGHYTFRVRGLNVMGMLTGEEASVNVFVAQTIWKTTWFWGGAAIASTALLIGISRYFVWHKMRREMARLNEQRALEQERLRIAHDIHDDLGARVTQISLLSAMAQENIAFPDKARADFDKVSKMARELVSALYETVWAVNPENDNLDALGNYLCQMVKQLCEQTSLRCRFHLQDLPHEVQVSSQTRHNISLAVKEAVHNVIKHAKASEVTIRMMFIDGELDVSIHDDGTGFQPADNVSGHGLSNMRQRLQKIGGRCFVESSPGHGTTVRMRLKIQMAVQTS